MKIKEILLTEAECPPATQDIELNTRNRNDTIKNYMYGPLNIDHPGDYWSKGAKLWDTPEETVKQSLCGNCVAFDISPRMEACMPGKVSDEHGKLGYCWMHHFKCHSARTCETWAKGGPITDDKVSLDWGRRANMNETATPGSTSAGNMATVVNPHVAVGKMGKSYTGSPGVSGTKAPKPPKPKKQKPTDNALDMKNTSIFGGPLKRI
ncbi:MAG: hypothetical protein EB168_02620 [Euryarchaeota archaeon]|nr:hypothetical protein [Euryarchaeota archaeon]